MAVARKETHDPAHRVAALFRVHAATVPSALTRSAFIAVVLCGAVGCAPDATTPASAALQLTPADRISFEPTAVGAHRDAELRLLNTGGFDLEVTLRADPPFALEQTLRVLSGAEARTNVRFAPVRAGAAAGALQIEGDAVALSLVLDGIGVATVCETTGPCQSAATDPDGVCHLKPAQDGTPCVDQCVTGGSCIAGVCHGNPIDCDDDDACTVDSCSSTDGCVHGPRACESPDPCHAPACDPKTGCALAVVADGTPCGGDQTGCISRDVCLGGVCRPLPVPDGALCGAAASPCQQAGYCAAGICEGAQPILMTPVTIATNAYDPLNPMLDDFGNLVVGTSGHGIGAHVFGVSTTGQKTWASAGDGLVHGDKAFLNVSHHLLPGGVHALDAESGTRLWFQSDANLGGSPPSGSGYQIQKGGLTIDPQGQLMLDVTLRQFVSGSSQGQCISSWRVRLDAATGQITRTLHPLCVDPSYRLGSDGTAIDYALVSGAGVEASDATGPLWSKFGAWFLGAFSGKSFISASNDCTESPSLRIVDGVTGTQLLDTGVYPRSAVTNGESVFVVGWTRKPGDPSGPCLQYPAALSDEPVLVVVDLKTGTLIQSVVPGGSGSFSELAVTDRGTVLVMRAGNPWSNISGALLEIDAHGKALFECPIGIGSPSRLVLGDERLYFEHHYSSSYVLQSLDLPGLRPAKHGWINSYGDNGASMRALP